MSELLFCSIWLLAFCIERSLQQASGSILTVAEQAMKAKQYITAGKLLRWHRLIFPTGLIAWVAFWWCCVYGAFWILRMVK